MDKEQKKREFETEIGTQQKLGLGIKVLLTLVIVCAGIAGVAVALFLAR